MQISKNVRLRLAPAVRLVGRIIRGVPSAAKAQFLILMFHDLPKGHRDAFRSFLDHVEQKHGFLTPAEAASILNGQADTSGRIPCLLTFDDGFLSNYEVACELLSPRRIRAVFFVCPGLMNVPLGEQRAAIARHILQQQVTLDSPSNGLRLMNWRECAHLLEEGHTIGCHTMSHSRLSTITDEWRLRFEVLQSADLLEERLGARVDWFAYPWGTSDSIGPQAMETVNGRYLYCCNNLRGVNSPSTDSRGLFRQHIDLTMPITYHDMVLSGGLDLLYLTSRLQVRRHLRAAQ
jgi:peptidoglycan/xylan/chitin deacetylase (PgdA/CDA1 family)